MDKESILIGLGRPLALTATEPFSEVPKAELVTQVPAHTEDDNFAIEVAPVEQSVNVFQLTHWLVLVKKSSVTDHATELHHYRANRLFIRSQII